MSNELSADQQNDEPEATEQVSQQTSQEQVPAEQSAAGGWGQVILMVVLAVVILGGGTIGLLVVGDSVNGSSAGGPQFTDQPTGPSSAQPKTDISSSPPGQSRQQSDPVGYVLPPAGQTVIEPAQTYTQSARAPEPDKSTLLEEKSRRRAQTLAARTRIESIQDDLDELDAAVASWSSDIDPLLSSDTGRQLAADQRSVTQFVATYGDRRVTQTDVRGLRNRLEVLAEPVESAYNDPESMYMPSAELTHDLEQLDREIQNALERYREDRGVIDALLRDSAQHEPTDDTLQAAIDNVHQQQARQRAEAIAEAKRVEREKADQQIAAAEAEKVRLAKQIELQKMQADAQKLADQRIQLERAAAADAKARELARQRAQLQRQFEADLADIKTYLAPFIGKGFTQPREVDWTTTATEGPASLGALRAAGALQTSDSGLSRLNLLGYGKTNDRPGGGFPYFIGGRLPAENVPYVKAAQELLIKYGELMVETEMLAP